MRTFLMKSANCSGWRIKMNNENLSKNLCEICGIEPCMYFVDCGTPECMEEEYMQCYKCPEATPIETYPDFEQSENFVKLLELNVDGVSLWWTINSGSVLCNESLPSNRKEFLKMVCRFIKNKEYIKQAIKSQEWAYE